MLDPEWINVTDLKIVRKQRGGPSDGTETTLYDELDSYYEATVKSLRVDNGREVAISGFFLIDPVDKHGLAIDVQARDWVQWTDFRGKAAVPQAIAVVDPAWLERELDHLVLGLE